LPLAPSHASLHRDIFARIERSDSMARPVRKKTHHMAQKPPFASIALLLQGGGALGSYQAGVYEALHEAGIEPNWLAGISIGSINAAIIAGNPPDRRVDNLRAFWEGITTELHYDRAISFLPDFLAGEAHRTAFARIGSTLSLVKGQPGFFKPRLPPPFLQAPGAVGATSFYDTTELKATLERLVDFDRINNDHTRLSVGAVNVRTGNFAYFDNTTDEIRPEHIMASGALPPGFPAVEIGGELYWDGGLVSNTPLQWVLDSDKREDTLAFQVDLWSAHGNFPRDLLETMEREKEIRFSSRTRQNTDFVERMQRVRRMVASLLDKLPPELQGEPEVAFLRPLATVRALNIVHLIYRSKNYEDQAKDYEFSRETMLEHWRAGHDDARLTLRHPEIMERPTNEECVRTFDLADASI
jgi:NTE family protein